MKKYLLLLILPILLKSVTAVASASEDANAGPLPSPYFVDEVHCTGLNSPNIQETWLLSKEEVEPAKKLEQEDMCERVLRAFGISKFMWLSPDDLERTATIIRQSGYFLESELSVRKSELQNHVHVFLKVTPVSHFYSSVSEDFKYFTSKGQASSRLYDRLSGEITNRKYSPVNVNSFGVNLMGTTATAAITTDPSITNSLTTDDLQKAQKRNAYLVDVYWKNQGALTKNTSYNFGFHAIDDNTYSDDYSRFNMMVDGSLLAHKQINVLHGSTFIGPAFIFSTLTPYQVAPQGASTNSNSTGVFFPGGILGYNYGQEFGNHLNFLMSYYHASGDQWIYTFDFDLHRQLDPSGCFILLGLKQRNVNDAVLPEDRFPLSSANDVSDYIGLGKYFRDASANQELSAVIGTETLNYTNLNPTYSASSSYVGLNYKFASSSWNVKVGLDYYFQRLY